MGHHHHVPVPPAMLRAAGALVLISLVGVFFVTLTGIGQQDTTPRSPVAASRVLWFDDAPDGSVTVRDASTHVEIDTIAVGAGGFLRATLRGLARDSKATDDRTFRIERRVDGQLLLIDPRSGRMVDLWAFGPANATLFSRYLDSDSALVSQAQETTP